MNDCVAETLFSRVDNACCLSPQWQSITTVQQWELWHQIYFQCLLTARCLHSGRVRWLLNYTIIPLSKLWPCRFNRWNISLILPQLSACSLPRPHMQKPYRTLSCWSTIAARASSSGYIQYCLRCPCLPTNRRYFKQQKSLRARFCGFYKKTHIGSVWGLRDSNCEKWISTCSDWCDSAFYAAFTGCNQNENNLALQILTPAEEEVFPGHDIIGMLILLHNCCGLSVCF